MNKPMRTIIQFSTLHLDKYLAFLRFVLYLITWKRWIYSFAALHKNYSILVTQDLALVLCCIALEL